MACIKTCDERTNGWTTRNQYAPSTSGLGHYKGVVVFTTLSPLYVYGEIFVAHEQVTPKRIVQSGAKSNSSEILCLSSLSASLKKIRLKNEGVTAVTTFFPLQVNGSFWLPWKPRVLIQSARKQYAAFPPP